MSDDQSARLSLPYLAAGQMQKHVTLNEALTRLDALVQTAVVSRTEAEQPADPQDGDLYILPADAGGDDWTDHAEGVVLRFEASAWSPVAVADGTVALVLDEGVALVRLDGEWVGLGQALDEIESLARLGLNTTADADNPLAVRLNAALFTALESGAGGDGDLRLKLNKETPADVLSVLMQSAWSGRAELGLIGDDQFRLKVSDDGSTWREVFAAAPATGRATFALGAGRAELTILTSGATYAIPSWARTLKAVCIGGGGGGGAGHFASAGTARFGGGGGGAGGIGEATWLTQDLPASLTITVGIGGVGGSASAGGSGSASQVRWGSTVLANGSGGGGGALGNASGGVAGAGGYGAPTSNAGGQSNIVSNGAAGRSYDRADSSGGGGGGGGVDAANTARPGGPGGDGGGSRVRAIGGAAGNGADGSTGITAPLPSLHWAGSGGGGGGGAASGAGFNGAAGGLYGAGGGGGGAGVSAGGTGGAGSHGVVWLLAEG